jgi:Leucine-rich repeat (LRR) protein
VYTENFVCLRTAAAVIQAATEVVRLMPPGVKRINTAALRFPPGTLDAGSGYDYSTTRLRVPVNDHLERRARAILRGESNFDRADAVDALRYFKSEENIRLMKSLLTDSAKAFNRYADQNGGVQVEFYFVRERAYEVLTGWGIDVPEPILREVSVLPDRVTSVSLSNTSVSLSDMRGLITDTTVRELARLPNLTRLDLLNDRLSDAAWESLATLKTLHRLDLAGTNVTDATLAKLASLPRLEELDLRRTSITSAGLAPLGGFSTLKRLRLFGTPGNAAAIAALQQRRPDLVIEIR